MPSGPQFFVEQNHNDDYRYHGQQLNPSQLPGISPNSYFVPTTDSSEREHNQKPTDSPLDTLNGLKLKTKSPSAQHRKERLSNTPVETLIQKLVEKESEARETKILLRTAIVRLEAMTQRAVRAEQECKNVKAAQTLQNLDVSQGMIDSQHQAAKAHQESAMHRVQLDHMRQELRRTQDVVKNVEDERDDAKRSASKARAVARKLNDERLVLFAREEGRRQGYEEGLQQGRLAILTVPDVKYITSQAHATPLGSGAAFIEDYEDSSSSTDVGESREHQSHHQPDMAPRGMHSTNGSHGTSTRRTPRPHHASLDSAPRGRSRVPRSGAASQLNSTSHNHPRHVQVNGSRGPQAGSVGASSQDSALRRELEAVKGQAEMLKRQLEQREVIRTYEAQQAERMESEREAERDRIRAREAELERERAALKEKERQKEAEREREMKLIKERDAERERERKREREATRERERELEEQKKREREAREREERQREREVREREEREREREIREREERQREREVREGAERERERKPEHQEEREREKVDKEHRPPPRLPYLPMPPPPPGMAGVAPPPPIPPSPSQTTLETHAFPRQSQQFQPDPRHRRRRTSDTETTRSPSSTASVSQLEIITFPSSGVSGVNVRIINGNERGDETVRVRPHGLPDIPEATESRTSVATASPPRWLHNPPVDLMKQATRGKDPADVESWRRSTGDHAGAPPFSPGSSDFLSPGSLPRGRVYEQSKSTDLRRTPSSSSSNVDIIIVPPSRPPSPSGTSHHNVGEIAGYLSPKHGPDPLSMETTQPVIPEFISVSSEPPPGFVAFAPPTGPIGGNGIGNGYSRPRSPIYSGVPLTASTSAWSSRDSAPVTPRQIYGAPFAGTSSELGQPVIPSPPRDGRIPGMGMGTPHHRSVLLDGSGGATPVTRARDLPPPFPGTAGAGTLNGVLPPHNASYRFSSMSYPSPEDEDEDEDEATRRNTLANANAGIGALPIPPPSSQKRW